MLPSSLVLLTLALGVLASRSSQAGPKQRRFSPNGAVQIARRHQQKLEMERRASIVAPKFFVLSMFSSEADVWYSHMPSLYGQNITVPGFSPLFPEAYCTASGDVCQMTCGEGEINAASSVSALLYSGLFDLTKTYFLVAGIAGINPHIATTGSVTFPRYAVQVDLQYEFDSRQIPTNWSTGYVPQNSYLPDSASDSNYPGSIYGTEAFELNLKLRNRFMAIASNQTLADSASASAYRKTYSYKPANQPPTVLGCASVTSNVYWSGSVLGDAFTKYTKLLTNGSGVYCASQQEDNAVLEVLLRGDLAAKVDFGRVAIMRTASDFDRAPPTETETFHLLYADQRGFGISIQNIWVAGSAVMRDVVGNWDKTYEKGIKATNYIGDLFNSLGRKKPDIGTDDLWIN